MAIEPAGEGDDEELEETTVHERDRAAGEGRGLSGLRRPAPGRPKPSGSSEGMADVGLERLKITPVFGNEFSGPHANEDRHGGCHREARHGGLSLRPIDTITSTYDMTAAGTTCLEQDSTSA